MSNDGGGTEAESRVIGGRYRLIERIGSGGMGTVWRALDELVERDVAVKQPHLPGDREAESHRRAANRLYREARAAARVDHPSAVSIHDVVVEDGMPWIVMELIRGESLHEVLRRGPLEPAESARIGLAVLGALRAAHAVGIVHRDVKPANVLLGPHGRVVLTDFGIAHIQGEESLTMSGEFVGSLEFIAPERMSGRSAGPASDLWSLGVLLYAAVEGRSPFRRTAPESTLAAILADDPPEPKQAGPLGPLIVRLLVREPERRPGAEETGAVLEAVAAGRPAPEPDGADPDAVPLTGPRSGPRWGPRTEPRTEPRTASASEPLAEGKAEPHPASQTPSHAESRAEPRAETHTETPAETQAEPSAEPPPALLSGPVTEAVPAVTETVPVARPGRRTPRGAAPLALLGALVAGGTWLVTFLLGGPDSGAATEHTATYSSAPGAVSSPTGVTWVAHREKAMRAVLSLPSAYQESARQGGAEAQPRLVVYEAGGITVRLTQWDKAPGSPMSRAHVAHRTWDGYEGDARTQYTRTSFHGDEAALADTTFGPADSPTRIMQLFVLTGDGRMYELRVDMPKGTADEKKGTAVFKDARDRLEIGKD
ncbi:protein kinase [Streptomyces sp. NPDC007264]|uniref:serine/threonine-protein kinase n=1 Tax=Streptomyces sp. NPDC007264 TaxID=3364777 RepID=UPI0036D77B6A